MKNILIIDTGGTFNKIDNPNNRIVMVDDTAIALKKIALHWRCNLEVINIIGKDSLDMTQLDRLELLMTINNNDYSHIIIIHGTDTMDVTAQYLDQAETQKCIMLTGAMVPFHNDPIEASLNFASAYGYLSALDETREHGVYIAMNGLAGAFQKIVKNSAKGRFVTHDSSQSAE